MASAWSALRAGHVASAQRAAASLCESGAAGALWRAATLAEELRRHDIQHLHAPDADTATAAILAARLAGVRVSVSHAETDTFEAEPVLAARFAQADLVVARDSRSHVMARTLAPEVPVELVRGGAVIAERDTLPTRLAQSCRFIACAPLSHPGGVGEVLFALHRLPERLRPRIDIVGDGSLADNVREFVELTGLSPWVTLLGPRPPSWIGKHALRYGAVVAAPAEPPGQGQAEIVAGVKAGMAAGLPAIVAASFGLADLVNADCGRLVPAGNAPALADAMVWVMRLPSEDRSKMGESARRIAAERFCAARQAALLARAIEALARRSTIAA
ncbi:MAG: glycosyltransferase [Alphaproteobacteria bacterium]|nr:glycosyltransferase [Alphaproteobacteria bacterium]